MKQLLQPYADYHLAVNQLIGNRILELPAEQWTTPVPGSFPSLHKTLQHMWDADTLWYQRVHGQYPPDPPSGWFTGDTPELVRQLLEQDQAWITWLDDLPSEQLPASFSYYNLKGEQFSQPLFEVLLHLFNHGTYHRGQLVTMLRSLGVNNIPSTDFVHWARVRRIH
ncbi:DinB family protein [Flavihumibacter petaseus]|uniref:DinB family protein n=1 Tax=Flavihumibacter petaseus NBRC 106054 TaxID=1220578 RepID=A0A0E9N871_9BACT|nr:DinB family protein [Flavihumibacter petaseus]GAO45580.1 hypothetical protein FPE01S_06_00710 [Flavihumibacter petaseus NBRC 106054]